MHPRRTSLPPMRVSGSGMVSCSQSPDRKSASLTTGRRLRRAQILLATDAGETDEAISANVRVGLATLIGPSAAWSRVTRNLRRAKRRAQRQPKAVTQATRVSIKVRTPLAVCRGLRPPSGCALARPSARSRPARYRGAYEREQRRMHASEYRAREPSASRERPRLPAPDHTRTAGGRISHAARPLRV